MKVLLLLLTVLAFTLAGIAELFVPSNAEYVVQTKVGWVQTEAPCGAAVGFVFGEHDLFQSNHPLVPPAGNAACSHRAWRSIGIGLAFWLLAGVALLLRRHALPQRIVKEK